MVIQSSPKLYHLFPIFKAARSTFVLRNSDARDLVMCFESHSNGAIEEGGRGGGITDLRSWDSSLL